MEKIKSFFRTHRQTIGFALLSATLPMLCVFIILFLRGVILRGDASLFSSAFAPSLLSAIAEAKEMGNGLLSFSRFRYNGDIFVLLASLFPASPQNSAIFSVMLCAGLTALSFYFTATGFGFGKKASSVLSVLYAVNAYAFVSLLVVGASSLLFVLPILMLTEHRLIQKGNLFPFALVLSFAFLLHIRFAWICLMAVVIWFFYDTFGLSHETAKKSCLKTLIRLGISFAVALCVGIANLTKGFQSLKFSPDITLQANFDFLSFFAKMMPTVYDGIHTDSLPYICFGLLQIGRAHV